MPPHTTDVSMTKPDPLGLTPVTNSPSSQRYSLTRRQRKKGRVGPLYNLALNSEESDGGNENIYVVDASNGEEHSPRPYTKRKNPGTTRNKMNSSEPGCTATSKNITKQSSNLDAESLSSSEERDSDGECPFLDQITNFQVDNFVHEPPNAYFWSPEPLPGFTVNESFDIEKEMALLSNEFMARGVHLETTERSRVGQTVAFYPRNARSGTFYNSAHPSSPNYDHPTDIDCSSYVDQGASDASEAGTT